MATTITASAQAPLIEEFIRGADYSINLTLTNSDGTAFNLTGCTVFFTMNTSSTPPTDSTDSTAALKSSANNGGSAGTITIPVTNTQTSALAEGTYWYDIKVKDSGGNMTPFGKNKIKVVDNITTRTS